MKIKDVFCLEEFVSQDVLLKYGDSSWRFLDDKLLETILFIRNELGKPVTINNWKWGGNFTQRGLRHNMSDLVLKKTQQRKIYLSAHILGKAIDFDVKGMTAEEVRNWLIINKYKLPHHIRLEKNVSWVHLDVATKSKEIISFF